MEAKVESTLSEYPTIDGIVTKISTSCKLSKTLVVVSLVVVSMLLIFLAQQGKLFVDLVGFIYPFFQSTRALDARDHTCSMWSIYWIIFVFLKFFEDGLFIFTGVNFPFYFIVKTVFLFWCYSPTTKGAMVVYDVIIKRYVPFLGLDAESIEKKIK